MTTIYTGKVIQPLLNIDLYTPISIKVALGFGHWNTEYNAMLWLSDHYNNGFQRPIESMIPKATFIEVGVDT